jgi:hypothetical protein
VLAAAADLPGVEVGTSYGTPSLKVRGKFMCRLRSNPDALVMRVIDLADREALLKGKPGVFFSTPHYDGYPVVLVDLDAVDPASWPSWSRTRGACRRPSASSPPTTPSAERARPLGVEQRLQAGQRARRADRHEHVALAQAVSAGGCGWKVPSPRRMATMNEPPRTSATARPSPAQPGGHGDLLEPVLGVDVHRAGDVGVQRQPRHLGAGGLVRRDDPVGTGAAQLVLRLLERGAGDDRDVRAQLAGGQRDEDVLGVGVHAGDHRAGALDAGVAQRVVLGRLGEDEAHPRPTGVLAVARLLVDDHVGRARGAQVARDLAADPPEAADDEVVGEALGHAAGAAVGEHGRELTGDHQLGQADQRVEQRPRRRAA